MVAVCPLHTRPRAYGYPVHALARHFDASAATAGVCAHNLCKMINRGWQEVEVAFGVSKRVP